MGDDVLAEPSHKSTVVAEDKSGMEVERAASSQAAVEGESCGEPEDGGGSESRRWLHVKHLPEPAKGWTWFKRYGAIGTVKSAAFYGLRKGQLRWALAECANANDASALVRELNDQDLGAGHVVSAKAITLKEREELARQGTQDRRKETTTTMPIITMKDDTCPRSNRNAERPERFDNDHILRSAWYSPGLGRDVSRSHNEGNHYDGNRYFRHGRPRLLLCTAEAWQDSRVCIHRFPRSIGHKGFRNVHDRISFS